MLPLLDASTASRDYVDVEIIGVECALWLVDICLTSWTNAGRSLPSSEEIWEENQWEKVIEQQRHPAKCMSG